MIIYKITNNLNGKTYIGQTRGSLQARMRCHKSESKKSRSNQPIHKAIRKYGIENFKIQILEENIPTRSLLNEREIYYISLYKSTNRENGYNVSVGGSDGLMLTGDKNPMFGKKRKDVSERNTKNKDKTLKEIYGEEKALEIKQKLSEALSGRKPSDLARQRSSQRMKAIWKTDLFHSKEASEKRKTRPQNLISKKKIRVFCPELNMEFDSLAAAANYIGGSSGNVSNVLSGKLKSYKGYTFERLS